MEERTVLAIDDDPTQLELLRTICEELEYPPVRLLSADTAGEGLALAEGQAVDIVLTDYRLPDLNGLEVVQRVRKLNPLISIVVITAYESAREAVEILKSGADDYLVKPTRPESIQHLILRIAERQDLDRESEELREQIAEDFASDFITFRSRNMARALNLAARSARSGASVLVRGESGTGKELVARIIHDASDRARGPFVPVNVAALPEGLVESELFGHLKGAFTGASADRVGRFEEADGGTLFIDEVGDIPVTVQVKLLRALQFNEVQRVGSNEPVKVDARIIAATNRDLEALIREGTFREDLYYRLNVIQIDLPPLRERKSDIPPMVEQFIARFAGKNQKTVEGISYEAMDVLMKHDWPGNIRELENLIERAVVLSRGTRLTVHDLPTQLSERYASVRSNDGRVESDAEAPALQPGESLDDLLARTERRLIAAALSRHEGNQSRAAGELGISERKLRSRMQRLDLENTFSAAPGGSDQRV